MKDTVGVGVELRRIYSSRRRYLHLIGLDRWVSSACFVGNFLFSMQRTLQSRREHSPRGIRGRSPIMSDEQCNSLIEVF